MDSRVRPSARRAAPRFDVIPSHVQGPGTLPGTVNGLLIVGRVCVRSLQIMYDCTGRPTGLLLVALWELPAVRLARSHSLTERARSPLTRASPLPPVPRAPSVDSRPHKPGAVSARKQLLPERAPGLVRRVHRSELSFRVGHDEHLGHPRRATNAPWPRRARLASVACALLIRVGVGRKS